MRRTSASPRQTVSITVLTFAAGFEALKAGMKDNHQQFPDKKMAAEHAVGEGNLVAVHSHVVLKPGDLGAATMHLFRFEGGKNVELWDFAHPVPAGSPNADGLF